MVRNTFFKRAFQRRFLLQSAASALALLRLPGWAQAAALPTGLDLTAVAPMPDDYCGGLVQIRVIGFGAGGALALERMAKYPAPGLSFLQFEPAASGKKAIKKALDCVHTVVLLVDESDGAQVRQAMLLGNQAKSQGLLTIGVALAAQNTTTDLADKTSPGDLSGSVHSFMRLEVLTETGMTGHASTVLRSLTHDLACICNLPTVIGVDYEDVLTILGEPGRLASGSGAASGPDRGRLAAEIAVAKVWPAPASRKRVKGLLVMISAAPGRMRLKESQAVMNAVRHQFDKEVYCIYGTIHDENAGDQLFVTVLATADLLFF